MQEICQIDRNIILHTKHIDIHITHCTFVVFHDILRRLLQPKSHEILMFAAKKMWNNIVTSQNLTVLSDQQYCDVTEPVIVLIVN